MSQQDEPELVETETLAELVPAEVVEPEDKPELRRDPGEVEQFLQREGVVNDFEQALNLLVKYQEIVDRLNAPDPQYEPVSRLLRKYQFVPHERRSNYRLYLDGREISDHTDSIPGSTEEDELLPETEMERINAIARGALEEQGLLESGSDE